MLTDLEAVARGEPPLLARKSYDLTSLAKMEREAKPLNAENAADMVGFEEEKTIDLGSKSLQRRLTDPFVLGLLGALLFAIIVIIIELSIILSGRP